MILEKEQIEEETIGIDETVESGIDAENLPFIYNLVTEKFYSNPIGSIVREIASNARDANTEAGADTPIILNLQKDLENNTFYVEFVDKGIGMDKDRLTKVYMKWFSSTKRKDNAQIGGFGIGSKSILAYQDLFYITSVKDGIKNSCMMYKSNEGPKLDFLSTVETDEPNGTTVKIDLLNSTDWIRFSQEFLLQLAYFDDVFINEYYKKFNNEYKIFETDTFLYRTHIPQTEYGFDKLRKLHLVIDVVSYPIDWDQIKSKEHVYHSNLVEVPVGIKFAIGELDITPNREQLQYSEKTINAIRSRIRLCEEELIRMGHESKKDTDNFDEYLAKRDELPVIKFDDTYSLTLGNHFNRRIKFIGLPTVPKIPDDIYFEYRVHNLSKTRITAKVGSLGRNSKLATMYYATKLDLWNNRFHENGQIIMRVPYTKDVRRLRYSYYTYLGLSAGRLGNWKVIKAWRDFIQNYIISKTRRYDLVDEDFINEWKIENRTIRIKNVDVECFSTMGNKSILKLEYLAKFQFLFYDLKERANGSNSYMKDRQELIKKWCKNPHERIGFITVNKQNYEKIKNLSNLKNISEFYKVPEFQNYFTKVRFASCYEEIRVRVKYSKYYEKVREQLQDFCDKYYNRYMPYDFIPKSEVVWQQQQWLDEMKVYYKGVEPLEWIHYTAPDWFRKNVIRTCIHITKLTIKQDNSYYESIISATRTECNIDSGRADTIETSDGCGTTQVNDGGLEEVRGETIEDSVRQVEQAVLPSSSREAEGSEGESNQDEGEVSPS